VFPAGGALPGGDLAQAITAAVAGGFTLAVQLAAPFLLAALVFNAALGLLARLVPSLQVFFVALPVQVLGGLVLMALLVGGVAAVWLTETRAAFVQLPGL
jgi:flagellar biosynthetic protein FliR